MDPEGPGVAEAGGGPPRLAPGDVELLRLLSEGLTLASVARRVGASERTVRRHVRQVCDDLGVLTPIEAVVVAVRHDLL